MSIVLMGSTSGSCTLQEQAVAGTSVLTLPVGTGTVVANNVNSAIVSGTAVASTSGTSITFSSIPSWAKRITIILNGTAFSAANTVYLIQIGSGSVTTTGYLSQYSAAGAITTGFAIGTTGGSATYASNGIATLNLIGSNTWISTSSLAYTNVTAAGAVGNGSSPALGGALDRVVITSVAGTATFTAGSINILYE